MRHVNHSLPAGLSAPSLPVAWLALLLLGTVMMARTQEQEPLGDPWVETRTPGMFGNQGTEVSQEWAIVYRIDATVRLPLLITAIPIASRADVGMTSFTARDFTSDQRTGVRAHEFFAASFPERARGLNRLWLLREAVMVAPAGVTEKTQFGVISSNREDTMAEADQVLDNDRELLPYSVIDSLIVADATRSRVLQLSLSGQWDNAVRLYDAVRPLWNGRAPTYTRQLSNGDQTGARNAARLSRWVTGQSAGGCQRRRGRRGPTAQAAVSTLRPQRPAVAI